MTHLSSLYGRLTEGKERGRGQQDAMLAVAVLAYVSKSGYSMCTIYVIYGRLSGAHRVPTLPLERSLSPIARTNFQCFSCGRALVRMSATMSSVRTHRTSA